MPIVLEDMNLAPVESSERPLAGMTILVVEDSRFASEAVRLLCLKSGARIRRADTLRAARRHLSVYQPSVMIVDLGLPDGSGIDLIEMLAAARPRIPVILATSGDEVLFDAAIAAGADGVLPKPVESLAVFQKAVLDPLPAELRPDGLRAVPNETVSPDPVAFRDDLAHIADVLTAGDDDGTIDYVAQFLSGVARSAHDPDLTAAAEALAEARARGAAVRSNLARVAGLVQERLERRSAI